jgi:predicted nucleic acid-binding protein
LETRRPLTVVLDAMELVVSHQLSFWDAVMLAAAAQAGCRLLVSEDMQNGFTWRGVTIGNPFDVGTAPASDSLG